MSEPMPTIGYAPPGGLEVPADRLVRRVVAWLSVLYGGQSLVGTALHVALARGWAASPKNMSWAISGGATVAMMGVSALAMCAYVVGGVLLMRRSRGSVLVLRAAVVGDVVVSLVGLGLVLYQDPTYASYWSTPATGTMYALEHMRALYVPGLVGVLTAPPLARRMV
jgi:hypothetical protein